MEAKIRRVCSLDDCTRPHKARGLCRRHYYRVPDEALTRARPASMWAHVLITDSCWLWTGPQNHAGYGRLSGRLAHRVIYERLVRTIPTGQQLDHLCRVRNCVRPDHLEAVTPALNVARIPAFSRPNAQKTHCPSGHEYTPENTRRSPSRPTARYCRACGAQAKRAKRAVSA